MRRQTWALLLLLCAVASTGSFIQCDKTGDTNNTFLTVPTGVQPTGNGGSGSCLPVERVRIVEAPGSLPVNQQAAIDVTPRDAQGNIRTDSCNEASGNDWTVGDDDVCSVGCPTCFLTFVRGLDDGDCELTACVDGKCDSVKFKVD